jgi:hypothetical protein
MLDERAHERFDCSGVSEGSAQSPQQARSVLAIRSPGVSEAHPGGITVARVRDGDRTSV